MGSVPPIWAAYVPGQEITKTPSAEYMEVAREVQRWINDRSPVLLWRPSGYTRRWPVRRPSSCDCWTRRGRFCPVVGWCWRGGGW